MSDKSKDEFTLWVKAKSCPQCGGGLSFYLEDLEYQDNGYSSGGEMDETYTEQVVIFCKDRGCGWEDTGWKCITIYTFNGTTGETSSLEYYSKGGE